MFFFAVCTRVLLGSGDVCRDKNVDRERRCRLEDGKRRNKESYCKQGRNIRRVEMNTRAEEMEKGGGERWRDVRAVKEAWEENEGGR